MAAGISFGSSLCHAAVNYQTMGRRVTREERRVFSGKRALSVGAAQYTQNSWGVELLRKGFLGCRAGAGTETRPYRVFIFLGGDSSAINDSNENSRAVISGRPASP